MYHIRREEMNLSQSDNESPEVIVDKWASDAVNSGDEYVTKILKQQEEGGLHNKVRDISGESPRKQQIRVIDISTMNKELYSKEKKGDGISVRNIFAPSFNRYIKMYFALFIFAGIFAFAVYLTN